TVELEPAGGTLELSGRLAGTDGVWTRTMTVPADSISTRHSRESGNPETRNDAPASGPAPAAEPFAHDPRAAALPIGALHGREIIADLELEEAAGADRRDIDRRIEARALRHRIVSRRTSLVA